MTRIKNIISNLFDLEGDNPKPIGDNLFMFDFEVNNLKLIGRKVCTFNSASKQLTESKNNPKPIGGNHPGIKDGHNKIPSEKRERSLVSQLKKGIK